jgi:peptidoglycan/LPS O-acetylase OafA/YrhL
MTLESTFDRNANALNALRLFLSFSVIGWHSFALTGRDVQFAPLRQLMGEVGVDGFFAISGFLIVGSWIRNPSWWRFTAARVLRIFPGFWVCLAVTAFVFAPLGTLLVSRGTFTPLFSYDNVTYLFSNALLKIQQPAIGETPIEVPFDGAWNGSLWTLRWEFYCYIAVLICGVLGLLKTRFAIPALFVLSLAVLLLTTLGPIEDRSATSFGRFGIMFAAGAMIYQYADRLPLNWKLVGIGALAVFGSLFLSDYRIVAALPLAYVLIGTGALLKSSRLSFTNDYSYGFYVYAFPAQQVLAGLGVGMAGVAPFALASLALTAPFAIASWFLVEKTALRLRPKRKKQLSSNPNPVISHLPS